LYVLKPSKIDLFTWCGGRGQLEQFALGGGSRHHHHHGRRRRRHCVSVCLGWMATGQKIRKKGCHTNFFFETGKICFVGRSSNAHKLFHPSGIFFFLLNVLRERRKKKHFFFLLLLLFAAPPDLMTLQGKGGGGCCSGRQSIMAEWSSRGE
jgi:hypothetical protein